MAIADLVHREFKALPEPLARQVLDFVKFLHERRDRAEWRDLMDAKAAAPASLWDNAKDTVWDGA